MDHQPNQLSGGQRQRVLLRVPLTNRLSSLPMSHWKFRQQNLLRNHETFGDIHANGNTVILVTHEEEIAAYAHRVIRLRDGLIESDTKIIFFQS
jgi:putative ABC transport system ATP-binding protein